MSVENRNMSAISSNLRKLIRQRGVTLSEVSHATGVPRSTLGEWSTGRAPRLGPEILKVAKYLGVSLESLIEINGGQSSFEGDVVVNSIDGTHTAGSEFTAKVEAALKSIIHSLESFSNGCFLINVTRVPESTANHLIPNSNGSEQLAQTNLVQDTDLFKVKKI